eukprot:353456-Chlamydomonas_euryale.AAC.4
MGLVRRAEACCAHMLPDGRSKRRNLRRCVGEGQCTKCGQSEVQRVSRASFTATCAGVCKDDVCERCVNVVGGHDCSRALDMPFPRIGHAIPAHRPCHSRAPVMPPARLMRLGLYLRRSFGNMWPCAGHT